jgi:hypothetical protein
LAAGHRFGFGHATALLCNGQHSQVEKLG